MTLTADDEWQIRAVLALHSHIADAAEWDRLGWVFSPGVILLADGVEYDGLAGVAEYERAPDRDEVSARLVLNSAVRAGEDDDSAVVWSRAILVLLDGRAVASDVIDRLHRTAAGWRIARRDVRARNRSRGAAGEYVTTGAIGFADWDA